MLGSRRRGTLSRSKELWSVSEGEIARLLKKYSALSGILHTLYRGKAFGHVRLFDGHWLSVKAILCVSLIKVE